MSNEFYMVIVAQAVIIGALTWVNYNLHRRLTKVESTIKLLNKSTSKVWNVISDEEKRPNLLLG